MNYRLPTWVICNSNPNMLTLEVYNVNSFVVRGDSTYKYKENLKEKGGKYNSKLAGGPGWVFRIGFKDQLQGFVNEVNSGDVDAISFEEKDKTKSTSSTASSSVERELKSLRQDYDKLMGMYRILSSKLDTLTLSRTDKKSFDYDTVPKDDEDCEEKVKPTGAKKKRFL